MNTVKFTGKVSGEGFSYEFDSIQAYNEKVTELLKDGISFSASTSTEQFDPVDGCEVVTPDFYVDKLFDVSTNYLGDESLAEPISNLEVRINEIMAPEAISAMDKKSGEELSQIRKAYDVIMCHLNKDLTDTNRAMQKVDDLVHDYQDKINELSRKMDYLTKAKDIIEMYKGMYMGLIQAADEKLQKKAKEVADEAADAPVNRGLEQLFKAIFGE